MARGGVAVMGADTMAALARDLRRVGDKGLRTEFYRGLNRVTKPVVPAVRASFTATLPKRGGLGKTINRTTKVKRKVLTGRNPGIKVFADGKHDIVNLNKGRLRHPLFGNRRHWFDQSITPGMFDRPLEAMTPVVQSEAIAVMGRIQRDLAGR